MEECLHFSRFPKTLPALEVVVLRLSGLFGGGAYCAEHYDWVIKLYAQHFISALLYQLLQG